MRHVTSLFFNFSVWYTFGPKRIWSQTHMVLRHFVPNNWSPIDWSLRTNGSQPIQSLWTNGPQKFGPHEQMVPNQFNPMDKWSLKYSICPEGQAVGIRKYKDQIGWRPFVHGEDVHFQALFSAKLYPTYHKIWCHLWMFPKESTVKCCAFSIR